ncbi:MAG: hypothetical protein K0U84_21830 [Actinomycetia bacterium]|nr:hypothetical protein [Actinomycetes bacterium]
MTTCSDCGQTFTAVRADGAYCSSACRQRAYRKRKQPKATRNSRAVTAKSAADGISSLVSRFGSDRFEQALGDLGYSRNAEAVTDWDTRLAAEAKQWHAKADKDVAAYKAKLKAEAERERQTRDAERERYREAVKVYRAKGLIEAADYDTIRSCLHPDSRASASDTKLAKAFRIFSDSKIKTLLVKEPPKPRRTKKTC